MMHAARLRSVFVAGAGRAGPVPGTTGLNKFVFSATRKQNSTTTTATVPLAPSVVFGARQQQRRSMWRVYTDNLERRPLFTKVTIAALIFFVSDSGTQYLTRNWSRDVDEPEHGDESSTAEPTAVDQEESSSLESLASFFRDDWDASRALSGAGFGVVATTWLHSWWNFLEVAVGARLPIGKHRLANTAVKVLLDQAIGAPLYIYTYYVLTNFGQEAWKIVNHQPQLSSDETTASQEQLIAKSWKDTTTKAADLLWPTMLQHWTVWPVVHSFNFYFAPLHHRVMVQNTVLVGWSGYLSYLNHQQQQEIAEVAFIPAEVKEEDVARIMTPDREINATLVRRETRRLLQRKESMRAAALDEADKKQTQKTSAAAMATSASR